MDKYRIHKSDIYPGYPWEYTYMGDDDSRDYGSVETWQRAMDCVQADIILSSFETDDQARAWHRTQGYKSR
jgi:hypothetical protein